MTTVLIIASRSYFLDDVRSYCSKCFTFGFHRPHSPHGAIKICWTCAKQTMPVGSKLTISKETMREIQHICHARFN